MNSNLPFINSYIVKMKFSVIDICILFTSALQMNSSSLHNECSEGNAEDQHAGNAASFAAAVTVVVRTRPVADLHGQTVVLCSHVAVPCHVCRGTGPDHGHQALCKTRDIQ